LVYIAGTPPSGARPSPPEEKGAAVRDAGARPGRRPRVSPALTWSALAARARPARWCWPMARALLALSDVEMHQVLEHARDLELEHRSRFLEALAAMLPVSAFDDALELAAQVAGATSAKETAPSDSRVGGDAFAAGAR